MKNCWRFCLFASSCKKSANAAFCKRLNAEIALYSAFDVHHSDLVKMEFEFDKEIDFLLRQTARSETASALENPKSNHLDADEIAAFAENALPEKARLNYVAHLADCDYCRKNLASLIALDSAAQSEIIHAEEPQLLVAETKIPWYRKLFAVPNLVYAMGALVLLFTGIGVYTVLQSNSNNSQVSGVYEKQIGGRGMASDGDASTTETFVANSNSSMSNMSAATNAMTNTSSNSLASASNAANLAMPLTAANANAPAMSREADKDLKPEAAKPAETRNETQDLTKTEPIPPPAPPPALKETRSENEPERQLQAAPQQNVTTQNQAQLSNQTQIMPDSRSVQRSQSGAALQENKRKKLEDAADDEAEKSSNTTTISGKTFRRENGVWYDAAYRGQATINVSRGTNEYKKLDSGLRQIVERIGGTVVVVWKEKAYRIQ